MNISNKYRRRTFLGTGLFSLGSLAINPFAAKGNTASLSAEDSVFGETLFMVESGTIGEDRLFLLGLLQLQSSRNNIESDIQDIRKQLNYRSRLTYSSNDRYKIDFAQAMMDYLIDSGNLLFEAKVFDAGRADTAGSPLTNKAINEKRMEFYKVMLKNVPSGLTKNTVVVKSQSAYGPSEYFVDDFKSSTNAKLEAMDSRRSDLLQLTDFITGCIRADIKQNVINKNKLVLIEYLQKKVQSSELKPGIQLKHFAISMA